MLTSIRVSGRVARRGRCVYVRGCSSRRRPHRHLPLRCARALRRVSPMRGACGLRRWAPLVDAHPIPRLEVIDERARPWSRGSPRASHGRQSAPIAAVRCATPALCFAFVNEQRIVAGRRRTGAGAKCSSNPSDLNVQPHSACVRCYGGWVRSIKLWRPGFRWSSPRQRVELSYRAMWFPKLRVDGAVPIAAVLCQRVWGGR
jgi:hypothetical protein